MNDVVEESRRFTVVLLNLTIIIGVECLVLGPLPRHQGTETYTDPVTYEESTRPAMVLDVDEGDPGTYTPRMWLFLAMLLFSFGGGISCYAVFSVGLAYLVGYGYLPQDVPAPAMCVYMGLTPILLTVFGYLSLFQKH